VFKPELDFLSLARKIFLTDSISIVVVWGRASYYTMLRKYSGKACFILVDLVQKTNQRKT
jgi:hypothetical protein